MKKAVETKNGSKFKNRELRVKRATPSERREKKELKKRERKEQRKEEGRDKKKRHHRKHREDRNEKDSTRKNEEKEIKQMQPFVQHAKRGIALTGENVDFKSIIVSRKKKDKQKVFEELIESRDGKSSRVQKFKNKVLKPQPTLNQVLKTKREKRKKLNMQKYTKIKIKKAA
jgi:hypothetical protein